jgi:hypothetical protein
VAEEHVDVGASTAGDRGREVGDKLTGGVGGIEREVGARERDGANKPGPRGSEKERERGRAGWRRQARPAYQAPRARGRWRARGFGLSGPTWVFYFLGNF